MRRFLPPLAAFGAGLLTIIILIVTASTSPAQALAEFFTRPCSSWWYFGNMLDRAGLMILAATGSALALRAGAFNLGGEAQIYAPALIAAIVLTTGNEVTGAAAGTLTAAVAFRFILALLCAAATGSVLGFIPGILKVRFRISEILSSFLLSAALLPVIDYLIAGPLRAQSGNLLATPEIARAFRIPAFLPPSRFNASFFIAIAITVLAGLFLGKTGPGYRLRMSGTAPEFARFAGFSTGRATAAGMTVSGLLHGLSGFFAITGTWYMCHHQFSAGMGWSALAVALIARRNIYAVIPAALLFSWLETASSAAVLSTRFPFDATSLVQGIVFLVISAQYLPFGRRR